MITAVAGRSRRAGHGNRQPAGALDGNRREAGRARAAAIIGRYWLERVPENPENCAKAIEWFTKADKLGSNEAPTWLGHLYRRFDCPQRNLKMAASGCASRSR